jgi:hypothetical protein
MYLRDRDDVSLLASICMRCIYAWIQCPVQLLIKVKHRNIRLDKVAKNLACPRPHCRHVGVRLAFIKGEDASGFFGGMPCAGNFDRGSRAGAR